MADWAHNETDRRLEELEKRIREVYGEAAKEIKIKADDYFRKLENRDTQMRNMVNAGEITPEYYAAWRQAQIGRGERIEALYRKLAQRMVEYDKVAIAYVNDDTPGIYSLNHDYMAYTIEQVHGNVDFTLYNEQAVRRLLQDDPDLFPQPSVDIVKDELWNRQKLQNALVSGILQGETLHDIAQRMQEVAHMDRTAAIRNARTAYTGAQNAGRQAAFERAARMGIKVQKRWMAIKDSRTRDSHGAADGQTVDIDEPFSIGGAAMMFPGDPSGPPKEVYNCRCTMRTVEKPGIEAEPREMRVRNPITGQNEVISEMTYSQWREWKRNQDPEAFDIAVKKTKNTGSDKKQWEKYRNQLGKNAPQTLAQFQELKYNGDWEKYKSYAKAIRTGELTPMATFGQYQSISRQIDSSLVGLTASNGVLITGKSDHFIARVIGSVEERRNGVSISDIEKALTLPTAKVYPIMTYTNGQKSQKIRLEPVEVTINPDTGVLIQTNPWTKE